MCFPGYSYHKQFFLFIAFASIISAPPLRKILAAPLIVLDTELSDDKDIQRQVQYQYCAANKLWASFSSRSNAVKNVLFHSFCTPMHEMAGFHISPQSWETLAANRNRLRWRASLSFGYSFIVSHKLRRKKGEAPSSSSIKTGWAMMYAHMHLNYGAISGSHAYRDCVWHIILDAGLFYTICPG